MEKRKHWENVYQTKDYTKVGWYQSSAEISLDLLKKIGISKEASVIDVGAGASTFVDGLIKAGYKNITWLDLSKEAFDIVKERLGDNHKIPSYLIEDVRTVSLPDRYDLWHDRAAFHFLQEEKEQQAYVQTMYDSLRSDGYAIIGTFALDGPDRCSDLPVRQYDRITMQNIVENLFTIVDVVESIHLTPSCGEQKFCFFILQPVNGIQHDS